MNKFEALEVAAKESTAKVLRSVALDQINLDIDQFKNLITELKKNGVDDKAIAEFTGVIDDSTKRNRCVAAYICKGGKVAEIITKTLPLPPPPPTLNACFRAQISTRLSQNQPGDIFVRPAKHRSKHAIIALYGLLCFCVFTGVPTINARFNPQTFIERY